MKTKCLVFTALGEGRYEKQPCEGRVVLGYCEKHIRFYKDIAERAEAEKAATAKRRESQDRYGEMLLRPGRRR